MSTENNTPQSSETWRERLAHTYWGKIKPLTTNISPDHLEDFVAHEIAEAERRGREFVLQSMTCSHEWTPCPNSICTSDLHNVHCKKCGKHGMKNYQTN